MPITVLSTTVRRQITKADTRANVVRKLSDIQAVSLFVQIRFPDPKIAIGNNLIYIDIFGQLV
ncbi:hypothetical protein YDYSY3_06960 [Paenibacillus chitinolyticus]|nr:hypothetical protein YDYSY3_06960 [Paenibacillus chitinolyticus]